MILLLAWLTLAHADDAEQQRLQSELHTLAARSSWSGVDRTYRELVRLGLPLAGRDHLAGYQAALHQGDTLLALARVSRVAPDARSPTLDEARRARSALAEQFGLVAIVVHGPRRTLERPDMPFAPDQRAAIEHAAELLRDRGEVRALLPVGRYFVAGQPLWVRPGEAWQTLVVD